MACLSCEERKKLLLEAMQHPEKTPQNLRAVAVSMAHDRTALLEKLKEGILARVKAVNRF